MIVAFTGPHKPVVAHALMVERVKEAILASPEAQHFISGGAYNIDTLAYRWAVALRPEAHHAIYAPKGKWHNEDVVRDAREAGHEVRLIEGGYLKRDEAMVNDADVLLAFPPSMQELRRSGTWTTIRRAWRRGIPVRYFPLDMQPGPVVRCF